MIRPYLAAIYREDEWNEGDNLDLNQDLKQKWFVEYAIQIADLNAKKKLFSKKEELLLSSDYLAVRVCSPSFFADPPHDMEKIKKRALVQESFSEDKLKKKVTDLLESIQASNEKELESKLSEFFIVSKSVL